MTSQPAAKALRASLTEKLNLDPNDFPVAISMEDGSIVMEGTLGSVSLKKRALLIAMSIPGVEGVVDRLKVRPSTAMSDDEIRDHLSTAFAFEPAFQGLDITAEIRDGVVDLEGEVWSLSHKRLAGVIAWWVPGVQDVINSIEVNPPEKDSDDELRDAVMIILEKDQLVDSHSIRVSADGFVITLEGIVASTASLEAAEDDAWFTWGVNTVINKITVDESKARENH